MINETKYYPDGTKRKEVIDTIRDGQMAKLIINYQSDGNISSAMEKPNFKSFSGASTFSGAHLFSNSIYNHYDIFRGGEKSIQRANNFNYPFSISGNLLMPN